MYCPNCGRADQTPDTYCRSCGVYLADPSNYSHLLNKIFGIHAPEQQVKFNLTIALITSALSALLVVFLMGYFDGRFAKTGESAPPIIYVVYAFLGIIAVWQLISFVVGLTLHSKLGGRKKIESSQPELDAASPSKALPEPNLDNVVSPSVTEDTTRQLDRINRR